MNTRTLGAKLLWQGQRLILLPVYRLVARLQARADCAGLTVLSSAWDEATNADVDRACDALRLVERVDPRRMRRIRADVRSVVLSFDLRNEHGRYWAASHLLLLAVHSLRTHPVGEVARTLVHEATHARLDRVRSAAIDDTSRRRHEVRARREEEDFLRLLARTGEPAYAEWTRWRAQASGPGREWPQARASM